MFHFHLAMQHLRSYKADNKRDSYWSKYGLTLSGYKYCGPFNKLHGELPTSQADQACKEHDEAYGAMAKEGHNPFTTYSKHDEKLIEKTVESDVKSDYGGELANKFFRFKRISADAGPLAEYPSKSQRRRTPTTSSSLRPTPTAFDDATTSSHGSSGGQAFEPTPPSVRSSP